MERTEQDPFLSGVEAVIRARRDDKIEIRTCRRHKFHAKSLTGAGYSMRDAA